MLPDNSAIRELLVDEYALDRNWTQAISTLAPIAYDPHESPQRAAAREQMTRLQAALQREQEASAMQTAAAPAVKP
jgi:hypothetical protein